MKTNSSISTLLKFICLFILFMVIACDKDALNTLNVDKAADSNIESRNRDIAARIGATVTLTNPGFESDKTGWGTAFAISTSDKNSGLKSAKLSASSEKVEQTVAVTANTSYTLKAWLLARGTLGVRSGTTTLGSVSANTTAWTQQTVSFNSGSATTVVIYGTYNAGEGRFDDFTLESGSVATAPAAPSALTATVNGTTVNLSWTDNSTNETGFQLQRKTGSTGTYAQVGTNLAVNATTFSNTGLTASTTYFYRIRAINAAGNSSYSNEVQATTAATVTPAGLLGLTASTWKINSHTGSPSSSTYHDDITDAPNVSYNTYSDNNYFYTDGTYTYFKAWRGSGVSTGSKNPRVELREMNNGTEASWSGAGTTANTMTWTVRVNRLPNPSSASQGVTCVGQIHAPGTKADDVIRVQFAGSPNQTTGAVSLKIGGYCTENLTYTNPSTGNRQTGQLTISGFQLNTDYTFKLVYSNKTVKLYNGTTLIFTSDPIDTLEDSTWLEGNYFKAGNYLQSVPLATYDGSFGLVGIKSLSITH